MAQADLPSLLEGLERGLALIESTRSREDKQVMLWMLLRDLRAARSLLRGAAAPLVSRYFGVSRAAKRLRSKLGLALSPAGDDDGSPAPVGGPAIYAGWKALGLPTRLANALTAAAIRTIGELAQKSREELLALRNIGELGAARCQALLGGAALPTEDQGAFAAFRRRKPAASFWVEAGVNPRAAVALVNAGIIDLETLAHASRESVLALRGVGEASVVRCEKLLGRRLDSVLSGWREVGLPVKVANALAAGGVVTLEALARMSREDLAAIGLNVAGARHCEQLLGRPIFSRVLFWRALGLSQRLAARLSRGRIASLASLQALNPSALGDLGLSARDVAACEQAWQAWQAFSGLAAAQAPGAASQPGEPGFDPVGSALVLVESAPS